jgi:cyclopropane fatty-acyl-phospholipid synthase-like methyltransferase
MLTNNYKEDEIQALIALDEITSPFNNPNDAPYIHSPKNLDEAQTYFRRFALDLKNTFPKLKAKKLLQGKDGEWILTQTGKEIADELRILRPPTYYWYRDFYAAVENSRAFDDYSKRVFGANFGQHGFSDVKQIQVILDLLKLNKFSKVLDIGCGNGKMAEFISDMTHASVTGIDYIQEAIEQATKRTQNKRNRLNFVVANLEFLDFTPESFDAIVSVDTIFFGRSMEGTITSLNQILKAGGRMAVFNGNYQQGNFLTALAANNLTYQVYDFGQEQVKHMLLKNKVAKEMEQAFKAEGNTFVWENLMSESFADLNFPEQPGYNPKTRYLYIIKKIVDNLAKLSHSIS